MSSGIIHRPIFYDNPFYEREVLQLQCANMSYDLTSSATRYFVFDVDNYFVRGILIVSSGFDEDRGMYLFAGDNAVMTLVPIKAINTTQLTFTTGYNYIKAANTTRYRYLLFIGRSDSSLPTVSTTAPT